MLTILSTILVRTSSKHVADVEGFVLRTTDGEKSYKRGDTFEICKKVLFLCTNYSRSNSFFYTIFNKECSFFFSFFVLIRASPHRWKNLIFKMRSRSSMSIKRLRLRRRREIIIKSPRAKNNFNHYIPVLWLPFKFK